MKNLLLSLSLLLLCGTISTAFAMQPVMAGDLILGKFDANLRAVRRIIAKDILKHINSLDTLVSNPTPDEIAWIDMEKEESKKSLERRINYLDSPEFQKYMLKDYLKATKDSLLCVIGSANVSREMYCWGCVSYLLVDPSRLNDAIMILKVNHKISNDLNEKETFIVNSEVGYNANYHLFGEGILRYILMPYIAGKKMGSP